MYFFLPMSISLLFSFWKDYNMISESALPKFFINFKLKLILIANFLFVIVVFSFIKSVGFNRQMFALKDQIEHQIDENLEKFKKEDEAIEKTHEKLLKKMENPKL